MKDLFMYLQFLILVLNIIVFIFIMTENERNFKLARVLLLIAVSVGLLINLGKLTWLTVLFSFTPFIALIKINKHGNVKKLGDYFRGVGKPLQKLQRSNKTVSNKEA